MHNILAGLILFCVLWAPVAAADLKLIPYPQSVVSGEGELTLASPIAITVAAANEADRFAAGLLRDELKIIAHADSTLAATSAKRTAIRIGRIGEPGMDAAIARLKVDPGVFEKQESYLLHVGHSGVLVASKTAEGVFYGVQTLRQLIPAATSGPVRIPYVTITDWPALRHRGLSVDVSRGPVPTEEQMRSMIRTLAEYKMNLISYYMEHVYQYAHTPLVPPEGGEISPELMKRIIAYARQYHIDVVPQQQTFAHLHHILKFELYESMAEVPHGHVLAAESPEAYDWIRKSSTQLAKDFASPYLHIGSDETTELGQGRSRAYAERVGVGSVYFEHMTKVADMLRPLNKKLMFWGDIALHHKELLPKLPKDLVAMTWTYEPRDDFSSYITPFRDQGLDVFVCPGLNNWSRIFPNFTAAVGNINNFVRDGKKLGAAGMFNTDWKDDGEALFNMAWYGIVFSAAAAWQPGTVDVASFNGSFDWAFYRNKDNTFAQAIRKLDEVNNLLRSAGVGDANDEMHWFDPFSEPGAERVRKAAVVAPQIRRLAEEAWVDIATNSGKALAHADTLLFLRFAAKRLDAVGMKIQYSREIADSYREKQVYAAGQRANDLRDYTNELKNAYRALWLSENRPYWIDNVLVRYDNEALYWVQKGRLFSSIAYQARRNKTVPTPQSLGLVLP